MQPHNDKAAKRSCLILAIVVFVVIPFSLIALVLVLWFGREYSGRNQLKVVEFKTKLADIESKLKAKAAESWLSRFDTILTLQITPAFNAAGDAFIRRALQHRIAALAIGIRIYEDRHGKFPKSLNDLSVLPMDVKQLMPTKDRTFGYRLESKNARLWGGTHQHMFSIPDEPPTIAAGEQDFDGKAFWTWEFRKSQ